MGRPKKVAVPKQKKIKLSKAQKQYAKMIHNIEADLVKKSAELATVQKQLDALAGRQARLNSERENLEGAKKNLEGILGQIPPPEKWTNFIKYVYEYHHHYHHHDNRPYPQPVYIGPWWQYYYGGGYITYPSQSQLQLTPLNPSISICDSPNIGGLTGGSFKLNSTTTTCEALPNSTIVTQGSPNGGNGMFMCHNANLPGLTSEPSFVNCASSSFKTDMGGPNISFTSSVAGVPSNGAPVEYTHDDADINASVTALQSFGFFDQGMPLIDAADMSVGDLLRAAK